MRDPRVALAEPPDSGLAVAVESLGVAGRRRELRGEHVAGAGPVGPREALPSGAQVGRTPGPGPASLRSVLPREYASGGGLPPRSRCAAAGARRTIVGMPASRPRRTLLLVALFVVLAGVIGGPLAGALDSSDGFVPPGADSEVAVERIQAATGRDPGLRPRPARGRAGRCGRGRAAARRAARGRRGGVAAARARHRAARTPPPTATMSRQAALDAFADMPGVTVGGPGRRRLPDRRDGGRGPRPRRADRLPVPARALAALLPRPRDAAAARGRDHDRARDVPRAHGGQPGLQPQRLRAQPGDRARPGARDRLHAVPRHPLSGGARHARRDAARRSR